MVYSLRTDAEIATVRKEVDREARYWTNVAMFVLASGVLGKATNAEMRSRLAAERWNVA